MTVTAERFEITDEIRDILNWAADTLANPIASINLKNEVYDTVLKARGTTTPAHPEWCNADDCTNPGNSAHQPLWTAHHERSINVTDVHAENEETNVQVSVERFDGPDGAIGETELCIYVVNGPVVSTTAAREIAAAITTQLQIVEAAR